MCVCTPDTSVFREDNRQRPLHITRPNRLYIYIYIPIGVLYYIIIYIIITPYNKILLLIIIIIIIIIIFVQLQPLEFSEYHPAIPSQNSGRVQYIVMSICDDDRSAN